MDSNLDNIVSVVLFYINHSIKRVVQHLSQCPHLSTLCISYMSNELNHDQLLSVIPNLTQLETIWYFGVALAPAADTDDDGDVIPPLYDGTDVKAVKAILQLTQLTRIRLLGVDLGDEGVQVTGDMRRLQEVGFVNVNMSVMAWEKFVLTLFILQNVVDVTLTLTNIDDVNICNILTSPNITVTRDDEERDEKGRYQALNFTSVPLYFGEGGVEEGEEEEEEEEAEKEEDEEGKEEEEERKEEGKEEGEEQEEQEQEQEEEDEEGKEEEEERKEEGKEEGEEQEEQEQEQEEEE